MSFQHQISPQAVLLSMLAALTFSACGNVRYTPGVEESTNEKFSLPAPGPDRNPQGGKPDADGDGLPDKLEEEIGSNPFNPDTDADGVGDGEEYYDLKTDPLSEDSDRGGVSDGQEKRDGTNPLDGTDDLVRPKPVNGNDDANMPPGSGNGEGSDNGNDNLNGNNPSKPQEGPPSETCNEPTRYHAWVQGQETREEFRPFSGLYSAIENYNYTSTSAYPLIGPMAQDNVLFIYLYESPEGVSLFFHANADQAPDSNVEHLDMNIRITGDGTESQLIFGDEEYHTQYRNGVFEFRSRHYKNSDGAVLGYLDGSFDIEMEVIGSTNTDRVLLATNSGDNEITHVLMADDITLGPVTFRISGESCE